MSYTIVQDPRELSRSRRVAAIAEITNVRMTAAMVRLDIPPGQIKFPLSLELKVQNKGVVFQPGELRVYVQFALTGRDRKQRKKPPLGLRCSYVVNYVLPSGAPPKRSEVQAFSRGNAVFNCWPYFRELVQNACARLGLPPPTLPLFKVKVKEPIPHSRSVQAKG